MEYLILAGLLYVGYRIWKARKRVPGEPAASASEAASIERFALYYVCDQLRYVNRGLPEAFRDYDARRPPMAFEQSILVALRFYMPVVEHRQRTQRDYELALDTVRTVIRNGLRDGNSTRVFGNYLRAHHIKETGQRLEPGHIQEAIAAGRAMHDRGEDVGPQRMEILRYVFATAFLERHGRSFDEVAVEVDAEAQKQVDAVEIQPSVSSL